MMLVAGTGVCSRSPKHTQLTQCGCVFPVVSVCMLCLRYPTPSLLLAVGILYFCRLIGRFDVITLMCSRDKVLKHHRTP